MLQSHLMSMILQFLWTIKQSDQRNIYQFLKKYQDQQSKLVRSFLGYLIILHIIANLKPTGWCPFLVFFLWNITFINTILTQWIIKDRGKGVHTPMWGEAPKTISAKTPHCNGAMKEQMVWIFSFIHHTPMWGEVLRRPSPLNQIIRIHPPMSSAPS